MATNKHLHAQKKKKLSSSELVEGILKGDRFLLAQALTLLESNVEKHRLQAEGIITACLPHSEKSLRIGITGVPGVGKSSFIESFGKTLIKHQHKVAILAVDPSSSVSKGSILGDKTRMHNLSVHPDVYIRPSPSLGTLGGVAKNTRESIILCEAAGYDIIIIETVGVGQSETQVQSMVDVFVLLMLAGAGDELQGIKRGIMEMANMFVINKSDGDNVENAKRAKGLLSSALHLFPMPKNRYLPTVHTCSATEEKGLEEIYLELLKFKSIVIKNNSFAQRRANQNIEWFEEDFKSNLISQIREKESNKNLEEELILELTSGKISPFQASKILLKNLRF